MKATAVGMLLAGVTAGLAACGTPTTPIENLEFMITVTPPVIAPGTNAEVTITVLNRDARAVTIIEHNCGYIRVFSPAGAHVGPPGRPCSGNLQFRRLESNRGIVLRDSWDGAAASTSGGGSSGRVPAGSYELVAEVAALGGVARSTPIAVQVTD